MDVNLTEDTTVRVYPDVYEGVARTDERFTVIAAAFGDGDAGAQYESAIGAWEIMPEIDKGEFTFSDMIDGAVAMATMLTAVSEQLGVSLHVINLG